MPRRVASSPGRRSHFSTQTSLGASAIGSVPLQGVARVLAQEHSVVAISTNRYALEAPIVPARAGFGMEAIPGQLEGVMGHRATDSRCRWRIAVP